MKREIIEAMKAGAITVLQPLPHSLLSIEEGENTNEETGVVSRFIRCETEVPKGYGKYSRCRMLTKIPDARLQVTQDDLDTDDFVVYFDGLEISYIDNRGNVYFRAKKYKVEQEA